MTSEEKRKRHNENQKRYYRKNADLIKEKSRSKSPDRRDYYKNYMSGYRKTQIGRARKLLDGYRAKDRKIERGECTLTRDWIIDHIFNSSCVYCGDSDWTHLGADRIDNSLPHTPENCVCSCGICNVDRQYQMMTIEEFKEYRKTHYRECDKQQRAAPN